MTTPWLPGHSEPIAGVLGVGVESTQIVPVAATVSPTVRVGAAVTATVS